MRWRCVLMGPSDADPVAPPGDDEHEHRQYPDAEDDDPEARWIVLGQGNRDVHPEQAGDQRSRQQQDGREGQDLHRLVRALGLDGHQDIERSKQQVTTVVDRIDCVFESFCDDSEALVVRVGELRDVRVRKGGKDLAMVAQASAEPARSCVAPRPGRAGCPRRVSGEGRVRRAGRPRLRSGRPLRSRS